MPFAALKPGSSRHLPDTGLISVPFTAIHCWFPPPLQVNSSMSAPFAVLAPTMSIHLPLIWMVPFAAIVHRCAAEPLQLYICTWVPFAAEPPLTSTHVPALSPAVMAPDGVAEPAATTDRLSNWSVW